MLKERTCAVCAGASFAFSAECLAVLRIGVNEAPLFMASLRQICLLCVLPVILLSGEPLLIKTPAEANSSPYDNLRIGVPVFTDYVVDREWFCIGYSRKHRQPLWVQYRLLAAEVENKVVERSNNFHKDRVIPESPAPKDYAKTGYDRGHMAPAGDMRWSPQAMSDSFLMTNMSPQHPRCNRATWKYLEEQVREWAKNEKELYVICGPVFAEKSIAICNGTIPVPLAYFKIVYDVTPPEKMIAFIIPNWKTKGNLQNFTVTVEQVEKITGFNFFSNLPEETQLKLETTFSVDAWSWRTPFNSKSHVSRSE